MSVVTDDVRVLIDTTLEDASVTAFILSAETFMEANLGSAGLTDTVYDEITKWLTAHMIAITRERQTIEEGAGGANVKYSGTFGEGLKSTSFGQMAISLDYTNTLLSIANGKKLVLVYAVPIS